MNARRILLGGLLAGVVINIIEFGVEPLLGPNMENWLSSLGLQPPTEGAMLSLALLAFVVGIAIVWLYAAIQPRFGAGPRTALIAGVAMWTLECAIPNLAMAGFGVLSGNLLILATVIPLVELPLAALAGCRMYREDLSRHTTRLSTVG